MFSITTRSLRNVAPNAPRFATKTYTYRIHTLNLVGLHDALHTTAEPPLQFHGLRLHNDNAKSQLQQSKIVAAIQDAEKFLPTKFVMSEAHPKKTSEAITTVATEAAKETVSNVISKLSNKVEEAQRKLGNADLSNAFDI